MVGLLDSLFNPSLYGGQNGGLLDFLRNSQMQQNNYQPSGGFAPVEQGPQSAQPIMVGDNQMPRIGDAARFDPSVMNSMAQMQPSPPQQAQLAPQQQPDIGFGDRLGAGLMNFANAGGLLPALAGGIDGLMTGQRSDRLGNANHTAQFLISKGIDPALAKSIVSDPATLRSILPSLIGSGGKTDDIKEFEYARQFDPTLTFPKFMQQKKSVSGEYGMQGIYGTDANGNPAVIQLGKSGEAKQSVLPPGFKLSRDPIKVDGPTGTTILDPQTRQQVGFIPKDIEGKESAEERGKARGLAEVALPNIIANAEQTLKIIKSVKDDPYRERGTGGSSIFNSIPATGGFDFAQKVEQLKGKAFLEAFTSLKGGGAITEIEGKKAENAIARLNVAQSEGAFLEALNELEEIVTNGIERAKVRAGKGGQPTAAPQVSHATNLKQKYGLD